MTAGTKGSWSGGGESDGELLVATADRLRWRAPELALVFARHAATRADAAQDKAFALRANALVVAALVRLGKHAEAVEPAVLTLREAESSGARELAGSVRVDLAASTRAIGLAGSAFVLVRPMLEGSDARPSVRAGALTEIVAGLAQAGRREVIDEVLSEADRLYAADDNLSSDVRRVLRALLCARIASFRRRWGNPTGAVAAATEGMTLLDGLAEPATDSGQARAELGLEMVSALLDAGEDAAALGQADQTLNYPVRATSAAAIGRLMLILATRVHMPSGRPKEAHALLAEIVRVSRRHELDGLLADVLTALAHAQEADGDLTDALDSLRSARAAEQRRLRADTMARLIVLEELGAGTRLPDDTEALLRRVVRTPARSLPDMSGREYTSREATSREMSGRELAGEDIGVQDLLARELTGWEMVARERAARESGSTSRALSDLIEADRAAPEWPTSERSAPDRISDWPSSDRPSSEGPSSGRPSSDRSGSNRTGAGWAASARSDLDRTSPDWVDSEFAESEYAAPDYTASEHTASDYVAPAYTAPGHAAAGYTASDPDGSQQSDSTGAAGAASSGGGRRRAPVEWSAADRVAADRAVSELASADSDDHVAAVDGSQPKWPDPGAAEERDEETGLLNRQGLRRRLAAARRQARPTALTLVRLEPTEPDPEPEPRNPDPDSTDRFSAALIKAIDRAGRVPEFDPDVLSSLADHVRDMAPDDAELVRPEEGELAVLMPDTTRDEAEQFAANLRETVSASDWDPEDPARGVSVSTGVAQYQEGTSEDALLSAAREDLASTESDSPPDWQSVEPVYDLPPEDSGYTYVQEYAQLSHDGPEPDDPEMAEYLAGFSLPEYGQWTHIEDQNWSHTEEPDMPPRHDIPPTDVDTAGTTDDDADTAAGRSVLDRLDITRGSGGRRRAPDSFAADQSADFQYPPSEPDSSDEPHDSPDENKAASDRSPQHSQPPPADWPYSSYTEYPLPARPPTYGSTGDEILAAAEEAARAALAEPEPAQEEPAPPATPGETPPSTAAHGESPRDLAGYAEYLRGSALRASIPHVPEPEEVPVPPETPDIPVVPNPDIDPQPGRRRFPQEPDPDPAHVPGRRPIPGNPDIDPTPDRPGYPADPDADPHGFPTDRDPDRHGFPGDSFPGRSGFAGEPDSSRAGISPGRGSDRHGVPEDLAPDRSGFPVTDPDRHGLPAERDSAGRGRSVDQFPGLSGFPAEDPDRIGLPADSQLDPDRQSYAADRGTGRRALPADSHGNGRNLPAGSEGSPQPGHRERTGPSEPDVESRGGRRRAPDDAEPQSGRGQVEPAPAPRLRFPDELADGESGAVEPRAGRRRMPEQSEQTGLETGLAGQLGGLGSAQAGRRRRIADYLESVERPDPAAAPGRRRAAEQAGSVEASASGSEPEAGRRRAPESQPKAEAKPETQPAPEPKAAPAPKPSPEPRADAGPVSAQRVEPRPSPEPRAEPKPELRPAPAPKPQPMPAVEQKPAPGPKPEPEAPKDPEEPRRRRWASILDGQERPGLPPEPSEPRDPPVTAAETGDPGKPSRMRRREKTDVKLADLLAEALVAYQASTSDNPDEDVLSAYDDAVGRVADENPRRERETGY